MLALILFCTIGLAAHGALAADDKKDREARRIQLLEQRLEDERSKWQSEKTALEKTIAEDATTISALKAANDKASSDLSASGKARASLDTKLSATSRDLENLRKKAEDDAKAKAAELAAFTKARQQERLAHNAHDELQSGQLKECVDRNVRLTKVAHEILQKYRSKGVLDALRQDDPVLGIGDTEMFNVVQDLGEAIDAERVVPPPAPK